jgi:RNA polymerase sigma factor (sigma-70 family)
MPSGRHDVTPVLSTVLLRTQSDERLVALARAGHERAFDAIFDRYRSELGRALGRYLPAGRVDDALQQTFLSAWSALGRGAEVRDLRSWLHRSARNAALAALSLKGFDQQELEAALNVVPGPEQDLERRDVIRRTLRGIAELPERQRAALLAVAVEGRSHADVAFELGISDTAARQLVRRARVALRTGLTAITPAPLLTAALGGGHGELIAGAALTGGGAGIVATGLKVSAVVAVISAAAPPIIHHSRPHHPRALSSVKHAAAPAAAPGVAPAHRETAHLRAPAPAPRSTPAVNTGRRASTRPRTSQPGVRAHHIATRLRVEKPAPAIQFAAQQPPARPTFTPPVGPPHRSVSAFPTHAPQQRATWWVHKDPASASSAPPATTPAPAATLAPSAPPPDAGRFSWRRTPGAAGSRSCRRPTSVAAPARRSRCA